MSHRGELSTTQPNRSEMADACIKAVDLAVMDCHDELIVPLEAAAAELRKMSWQPIAAAPKDGTFILACQRHYRPFLARWVKVPFGGYFMGEGDADGVNPTHWMPLPAPPANTEGDTK